VTWEEYGEGLEGRLTDLHGRTQRGEGKPETFDFLGFTHICGTNYQTGNFTVRRKTMGKRLAAKLKDIRAQLRRRIHASLPQTVAWLRQVVRGYFQYHAVPGNWERFKAFRREVQLSTALPAVLGQNRAKTEQKP
jgi:hypothetical protein